VVFRGGLWQGNIPLMRSTTPSSTHFDSFLGLAYTGIRVATVPEPSSFVLAALGLIGLVVWRRNRSWR
jgi:hypothetical protein